MKLMLRLALPLIASLLCAAVEAQEYPTKPIRMIVPFGAGGPTDVVARWAAESMAKQLGQTVIVENKPGAAGRIGLEYLATQPADGYTIGFVTGVLPSLQAFFKDWKRDVLTSFTYIGTVADDSSTVLVGAGTLPGNTLADTMAYFKANPGKLNIAYTAPGIWELMFAHLDHKWGLNATRVAYKGTSEAKLATLSGDVHMYIDSYATTAAEIKSGKLKLLAVLAPKRLTDLPNGPTISETKTTDFDFDVTSYYGAIGPAGMPAAVLDRLNRAMNDSLKDPELLARINSRSGMTPMGRTPAEFRTVIKQQTDLTLKLAREYKIEAQ